MKSKAAVLWFVVSVALAAALVVQWNAGKKQEQKLEQLQLQVEKSASRDEAEARVQEIQQERARLQSELQVAEAELNRLKNSTSSAAPIASTPQPGAQRPSGIPQQEEKSTGGGNIGQMLGKMLKDPEMRKAMEQQQRMGMDMVYGALFKELQLTPDQQEKFKDLLIKQQMDNMSQAEVMFGSDAAPDRSETARQLAEKNKETQEAIKTLLGEDKYAEFQEYNQTIGERLMLDQLGRQADLTPDQNDQLLAIIREEKKNVQINWGEQPADPTQDWQKLMGDTAGMERMISQQEEVNKRVIERAGQVLTPDQLQKFGPLMKNQLEMQKAGLKMARQMMGGENPQPQLAPSQRVPE